MTQVFVVNSAYGLMTAVAAMDAGVIGTPADGRVLVTVNAAIIPEAAEAIGEASHLATLRSRFDRVVDLNELLAPERPPHWRIGHGDAPILERLLRTAWGLGSAPVELFLQSPQVAPSRVFLDLFPGAAVTVLGDGLMTYSPIRSRWPQWAARRVVGVVYADTVPGLAPLLFAETGAPRMPVPVDALRRVVAEVAERSADADLDHLQRFERPALVLGQYLAALKLVSAAEERDMQERMIDRALEWSPSGIVFKPHPSSAPALIDDLRSHAHGRGVDFMVYRGTTPAEVLTARAPFAGAVAGFSTALPTVQALTGSPIAAVGTETLLARLAPYENGNRIPVTVIDALTRPDPAYRDGRMQELVDAVGYAMQPETAAHLRPRAEAFLAGASADEQTRYFSYARLTALQLAGGPSAGPLARALASRDAASRLSELQLVVRGAGRRGRRAWKAIRGG
ncbi:polysialyltransferase family glycosyltransferase [Microbacterium sp. 179-B 1A2 NHS]|uniref:polysialyltransferase family glycosyltransferase n=1 Tax=Microbacterium sp. 179-B 1A2 NHS TaxID=3142383 RepID=UPI0039A088D1